MLDWLATATDVKGVALLEKDEGATVMRVPGIEVPLMVKKSDGGYGYDTTGELGNFECFCFDWGLWARQHR